MADEGLSNDRLCSTTYESARWPLHEVQRRAGAAENTRLPPVSRVREMGDVCAEGAIAATLKAQRCGAWSGSTLVKEFTAACRTMKPLVEFTMKALGLKF